MMSAKNGEGVKKDPIFADKQCIHFADNRGGGQNIQTNLWTSYVEAP